MRSVSRMPSDSNWNTPIESPRHIISKVFGSSSGSEAMSGRSLPAFSMIWRQFSITSRLRRPRKSILSRPSSSIGPMEYCVMTL